MRALALCLAGTMWLSPVPAVMAAQSAETVAEEESTEAESVTTVEETSELLREAMLKRQVEVTIPFRYSFEEAGITSQETIGADFQTLIKRIEDGAYSTGQGLAQDQYLKLSVKQIGVETKNASITVERDEQGNVTKQEFAGDLVFTISYYESAEQKAAFEQEEKKVLESLSLEGKSEIEKIRAIYSYLCETVAYDSSAEPVSESFSGYGALVEKKAVCEGYALALNHLLEDSGIPAVLITGKRFLTVNGKQASEAHAWNLIQLDGKWYEVDATWDANGKGEYYNFFLQSEADFLYHRREEPYSTAAFQSEYPVSETSYPRLQLDTASVSLGVGETTQVGTTFLPTASTDVLSWKSSDAAVASVDSRTGLITAKGNGTAVVTAVSPAGASASVQVTVSGYADSLTLSKTSLALNPGDSAELTATISPATMGVAWSSSNEKIATVDQSGKVTAVAAGSAQIIATAADGATRAVCTVKVQGVVSQEISLQIGQKATFDQSGLTWASTDDQVVRVTTSGGRVTLQGLKGGYTTISGERADGTTSSEIGVLVNFDDMLKAKAWKQESVNWALKNKITSGVSATAFGPDQYCTRGQIMTFIWKSEGSPAPASSVNPFTDMTNQKKYFYNPVLWAVGEKITSGTSATTFSPNATCTRAQIVTFLWNNAGKPEVSGTKSFSDVGAKRYYAKAVSWAVAKGITSGISATKFGPNEKCTRAQAMTFLYKYSQLKK